MSAYVDSGGVVVSVDGKAEPDEAVTEEDVKDPQKLARMVASMRRDLAALRRQHRPQRIVFRDVVSTGTTVSPQTKTLEHGLAGRVYWWVGQWVGTGTVAPCVRQTTATTDSTLVLQFLTSGTATIVVEEAG